MYHQKVISYKKIFFASSMSLTKRPGSVSQRYVYVDPDPDQNVTDPEHWWTGALALFTSHDTSIAGPGC
jgi:hypothetical protein